MALLKPTSLPPRPSWLSLALIALLSAGVPAGRARGQQAASEYQVKGAYLLNFARFVEWPSDALPASAPIQIAIVGNDPFGGALELLLRSKTANGHPLQLRHARWNDNLKGNQIVFISGSEEAHLPEILHELDRESVLTVSDIDRFSLRGGAIELVMVGNHVRFDVNWNAAITARLGISSKLMGVARAVHDRGAAR